MWFGLDDESLKFFVFFPVVLPFFLTIILFTLGASFKAAYGKELLIYSLRTEIASHSAPDGRAVNAVTLAPSGTQTGWLRHSLYEHPEVVPVIARWAASRINADNAGT